MKFEVTGACLQLVKHYGHLLTGLQSYDSDRRMPLRPLQMELNAHECYDEVESPSSNSNVNETAPETSGLFARIQHTNAIATMPNANDDEFSIESTSTAKTIDAMSIETTTIAVPNRTPVQNRMRSTREQVSPTSQQQQQRQRQQNRANSQATEQQQQQEIRFEGRIEFIQMEREQSHAYHELQMESL